MGLVLNLGEFFIAQWRNSLSDKLLRCSGILRYPLRFNEWELYSKELQCTFAQRGDIRLVIQYDTRTGFVWGCDQ